jgi:hypothetical protein
MMVDVAIQKPVMHKQPGNVNVAAIDLLKNHEYPTCFLRSAASMSLNQKCAVIWNVSSLDRDTTPSVRS